MNTVRYSPKGEVFCSGGADGKAVLYEGKTGEKICSLGGEKAHSGGIYGVSVLTLFYGSSYLPFLLSSPSDQMVSSC